MKNNKKILELVQWITNDLPFNGKWWLESTYDKFIEVAKKLSIKGLTTSEIKEVLSDLYSAMCEEFGG